MPIICKPFAVFASKELYIYLRSKEKGKMTNNNPKNITQKTKGRATPNPTMKTGDELRCSRWVGSSCSTRGTRFVNVVLEMHAYIF